MTSLNSAHDPSEAGRSQLSGLRVLVIEDSWQVGAALKRLLMQWGADVAGPVATTADAMRLISERTFEVALVDIDLRGGEQAHSLIDQLHDQGIHVLVITGYADVSLGQGKVAKVLQKPVTVDLLLRSLRTVPRR
jgi:DNA-binding NtrC family response regulator